ncbi:hypothetical protein ACHAWF_009168, partial [Thalassiosira exigua]
REEDRGELVRFLPFRSAPDPSFFLDHGSAKLNELRLDEGGKPLRGDFGFEARGRAGGGGGGGGAATAPGMRFDSSSLPSSGANAAGGDDGAEGAAGEGAAIAVRRNERVRCRGEVASLNTLESFKRLDKNKYLDEACLPSLLRCCGVSDGGGGEGEGNEEEDDPNSALVAASCLTYCDLKSNRTAYWFAFPALAPRPGRGIAHASRPSAQGEGRARRRIVDAWGPRACRRLARAFRELRVEGEREARRRGDGGGNDVWCPPFFLLLPSFGRGGIGGDGVVVRCLRFGAAAFDGLTEDEKEQAIFGFVDPTDDDNGAVGWTLRNLVAYVALRLGLGGKDRRFLSYRPPLLRRIEASELELNEVEDDPSEEEDDDENDAGVGRSLLLDISVPLAEDYRWPAADGDAHRHRCVGWESNRHGKPGPRSVDLRPLVSPAHLVRQANDLNLRLMKWRALPSLDVERLGRTRALLLGAGTLGCGVARTLLGWGVRKLTFVDSGRVSYSNPVRQSLYVVDDCKEGGKRKAEAAAASLSAVAGPDVEAESAVLTIPMPGHPFGGTAGEEVARKDVERLHQLVEESDAVFLLTDTRESRWLPTVMALATDTPMINAALGLDSWLVMRHGPPPANGGGGEATGDVLEDAGASSRLGCYFCSDVVAPENSMRDRTLDQQCTVTRPGLAPIASAMASELLVALLHHPEGHRAPAPTTRPGRADAGAYAPTDDGTDPSSSALGRMPHQIRGTVATYTTMTPTVPAFPSCTACSGRVVEAYRRDGFEFVKKVCCDASGSYLEEVSGLKEFRERAAAKLEECLDWDDDDDMEE